MASPLVGFRKYERNLKGKTLFTVTGVPAGQRLRFGVLDDYDGSVWTATSGTVDDGPDQPQNAFQRVGGRIPTDKPRRCPR